ncbi:MAG: glycoside hydrolase family 3 protein, partial [Gemmatimonadetes bacterium]|nr:glycoside hydrolase family 3 protein [Gemmatimonadota bacterium]
MSTTLPYLDADLPVETRIEDLVGRMTLEEKASQLLHSAAAVERLGVPAYDWWNEALHGIARSGKATVFPQAIGIAATFNVELMEQIASVISDEGRAKHHAAVRRGNRSRYTGLTFWSPNVNIFRDPRWGRGQETFGEDPFLTAELGGAFVHGMQGDHPRYLKTAACAKHFAVHSGPEALRHEFDAVAEEKDLQETYLPAFEHLVKEGVEAIMGAYNRTNGEPCCASADLMGRLRDEWGFQGHFLSDCWAVRDFHEHHHVTETPEESVALALSHGCDLNCGCTYERVLAAVRQGLLDEAFVDASLRRLLQTRFRLGMFDPPEQVPWSDTPSSVVDCEAHRALARKAAVQSMVLLKNDNAILPLREDIRRIAVLGHNAAAVQPLLGNYYGLNSRLVTVLEGIIGRVPDGVSVEYRHACLMDRPNPNSAGWAIGDAGSYEVAIAVVGLSELFEGEEGDAILSPTKGDRDRIELPEPQCTFLERLMDTGVPTVVVVMSGSPIAMPEIVEKAAAVLWAWYPGEEGGNAIADVLFGDASPAGRLPITFPVSTEQLPPFEDYAMAG